MLGPVELDGPYIAYANLNAKLTAHLQALTLEQGEELVNYLAALPQAQGNTAFCDYLHEEMALMALCRDDLGRCRRHKQRLSNPSAFFYDRPLDKLERRLHKQMFGKSRGTLVARLNFQRIRAARHLLPADFFG